MSQGANTNHGKGDTMRSVMYGILGAAVAVGVLAGTARATHNEPLKASFFKSSVVTAYDTCTNPDTSTDAPGLVLLACTPVRSDPTCGFGPKGSGKMSAKSLHSCGTDAICGNSDDTADFGIKASLAGLDAGCEGETLTLTASTNPTTDDCGGNHSPCTVMADLVADFAIGSCVVGPTGCGAKAKCTCLIDTTVNTFSSAAVIEPFNHLGLEIRGAKFKHGSLTTFSAGTLAN